MAYARQRAVLHMEWDGVDSLLQAVVRGSGGDAYETSVYFKPSRGVAELAFAFGECTCPVGINCKHVVAAAVTAMGATAPSAAAGRAQPAASWEQSLGALHCTGPAGLTAIRCRRPARPRALPLRAAGSRGAAEPGVGEAETAGSARAAGSYRVGGRPDELGQARNLLLLQRLPRLAPASATGAVRTAHLALPERRATTPATTRRSTSPHSTAGGCGRCWTRPPKSACSSCTPANG